MDNRQRFECHITFFISDATLIEEYGTKFNWKFSKIEGDALLEQKPYCYLTNVMNNGEMLLAEAWQISYLILKESNIHMVRIKLEEILFDTKTGYKKGS